MVSFKSAVLLALIGNTNARLNHRGNRLAKAKADADAGIEDIEFWTRMMQVGSLPLTSSKPSGRPTRRPTPRPTPR
jgi:hypothetical protein